MTTRDLAEIVAADLASGSAEDDTLLTWEEYARDMWTDREQMYDEFPEELSFISWRALVRQVASELGLP